MMVDAGLILIVLLALGILMARHWPQPLLVKAPKNPLGFVPNT
jgi:hypothetical protein